MPLERCTEAACLGCGACAAVCPRDAVAMVPGEGGFLYPKVDPARCVRCGLCDKACPIGAEGLTRPPRRAYAAWAEGATRAQSTSGGAFTAIARAVLAQGGAVCGAVLFLPEGAVRHVCVEDEAGLARLRKSKYAQSEAAPALREALGRLRRGQRVLFVGTPCQVAAWRRLAGPFGDLAPACDLVCGGVPSPALFQRYLREEEARARAPIADYDFRDKRDGWNFPAVRLVFADGKTLRRPLRLDPFYAAFAAKLACRLCCAECPYSQAGRVGDLTIADCWHVATYRPDYDDGRGTSLLLAQTDAGERVLGEADLRLGPYDVAHAVASNLPLRRPLGANPRRGGFLSKTLGAGAPVRQTIRQTLGTTWILKAWLTRKLKRLLWPLLRTRR